MNEVNVNPRGAWDGRRIVRERAGERQQFVRLRPGRDPNALDLPGEEPAFERELRGHDRPLDPRLDFQRQVGDGRDGGRERQILGRVVPRLVPEERDQIAESLDKG